MTSKKSNSGNTSITSFFSFTKNRIQNSIDEYIKKNVTQKVVRYGEMSLAFLMGCILVLVGLAQFIASQISFLENGLNYIVLGSILLLIAYFLS